MFDLDLLLKMWLYLASLLSMTKDNLHIKKNNFWYLRDKADRFFSELKGLKFFILSLRIVGTQYKLDIG